MRRFVLVGLWYCLSLSAAEAATEKIIIYSNVDSRNVLKEKYTFSLELIGNYHYVDELGVIYPKEDSGTLLYITPMSEKVVRSYLLNPFLGKIEVGKVFKDVSKQNNRTSFDIYRKIQSNPEIWISCSGTTVREKYINDFYKICSSAKIVP